MSDGANDWGKNMALFETMSHAHEKECALAALALRIEKAKTVKEREEMRQWYREVLNGK